MKKRNERNVYEKKITLGRDENGRPIRQSVYGATKAETEKKAFELKQQWQVKSSHPTDELTVPNYALRWFATTKALRSINTKAMYQNVIEKHIIPELRDLYFSEVTLSDLQILINNRADKVETCKKIKLTLKQIFEAAKEEGYPISINIEKLVLPTAKKKEKRALTPEEKNAIFECSTLTEEQKMFLYTLYYSGIRREEALALKGSDIDLQNGTLTVSKTLIYDNGIAVVQNTAKNAASLRTINIPSVLVKMLSGYITEGYLFPMPSNHSKLMSLSSYVKFWQGIQKALLPLVPTAREITAHILRHNYATLLYYSNISRKKAAEIMGHATTKMIDEIYAHLDESKENVKAKIEDIFK